MSNQEPILLGSISFSGSMTTYPDSCRCFWTRLTVVTALINTFEHSYLSELEVMISCTTTTQIEIIYLDILTMNMHRIKFRFSLTSNTYLNLAYSPSSLSPDQARTVIPVSAPRLSPFQVIAQVFKDPSVFVSSHSSSLWYLSRSSQIERTVPSSVLLDALPSPYQRPPSVALLVFFSRPGFEPMVGRDCYLLTFLFSAPSREFSSSLIETRRKFISSNNLMTCP